MLLGNSAFGGGHIFYFVGRATFWSPLLITPVYLLISQFPGWLPCVFPFWLILWQWFWPSTDIECLSSWRSIGL